MSRTIDTTQWPLSKEDREYMLSRGRESELADLDTFHASLKDPDLARVEAPAITVDQTDEPYTKWKVAELEEEIRLRNAEREDIDKIEPSSGVKADLVAALEADDTQNPA
jgi:hypothetical protein